MIFEKVSVDDPSMNRLFIVLEGKVTVQFQTHSIRFREGECYVVERGLPMTVKEEDCASFAIYGYDFAGSEQLLTWPIVYLHPNVWKEELAQIEAMRKKGTPFSYHASVYQLLEEIERNKMERNRQCIHQMEQVQSYVQKHYREALTLQQMAEQFYMSPNHLNELFKRRYGMTLMTYVTDCRIRRAKQLLVGKRMRVRDTAHAVGYDDEFYFSRKFKKETGKTPTQYVKEQLKKQKEGRPVMRPSVSF